MVTDTASTVLYEAATTIDIAGSGFAGTCSVVLSADSGTVTQPTSVVVDSSTSLTVTVAPLSSSLAGNELRATVTCDGVSACTQAVGTVTTDLQAPVFTTGFPSLSSIADTSFSLDIQADEAFTSYWVVILDGASAPSSSQVKAGTDGLGLPALLSGSSSSASSAIAGVVASSNYDVWVVLEDAQEPPNLQTSPTKVDLATGLDATPPTFITATATSVQDFSFVVSMKSSENGNMYYVVALASATAPTPSQVVAGTDGADGAVVASGSVVAVANVLSETTVTAADGIEASTSYKLYMVAAVRQYKFGCNAGVRYLTCDCCGDALQDLIGPNLQAAVTTETVTTNADATPPVFASGFPRAASIQDFQFDIEVKLDEPGSVDYVIVLDNDDMGAAIVSGTIAVPSSSSVGSATISSSVTASTAYDVYFRAEVRCRCGSCRLAHRWPRGLMFVWCLAG